jgi:hypothetical protein
MEGPFPLASAAKKAATMSAAQRVTDNAEVMIDSCSKWCKSPTQLNARQDAALCSCRSVALRALLWPATLEGALLQALHNGNRFNLTKRMLFHVGPKSRDVPADSSSSS